MAIIEGIGIKNYGVLQNVVFGKVFGNPEDPALTSLTAVIGKNGVGKSTLFDAFGFLSDCLKLGVEEACDQRGRGGFDRIRSQGGEGPIMLLICYREEPVSELITYWLIIDGDESGRPFVVAESLFQQHDKPVDSSPSAFLMFLNGEGLAWKEYASGRQLDEGAEVGFDEQLAERFLRRLSELMGNLGLLETPSRCEARTDQAEAAEWEFIQLRGQTPASHRHPRWLATAPTNRGFPPVYRRLVLKLLYP